MNKDFFYIEKCDTFKQKYLIKVNREKLLFPNGTDGSYNVFIGRVLGLPYMDYLRYCRDRLGADIIGKTARYPTPYFDNTKELRQLVKLLNKRMEFVMNEHDFPYYYTEDKDGNVERVPFNENESNDGNVGEV